MVSARLNRKSRCQLVEVVGRAAGHHRRGAEHVHGQLAEVLVPARPQQLHHRRLGARLLPPDPAASVRSAWARMHLQADPGPGQPVAQQRVRRRARCAGPAASSGSSSRRNPICWPRVAAPRSMASVARATRQPSPGSPTTRSASRAGAVEEHLVELGRAGELPDRADRDPRLAHRHEQVGQACAAPRARLGPGQHEAPVGHVRQRRPHLLAGDHPLAAVAGRPWWPPRPGRSRRPARSSPGTTAPRRPRSAAGTGAAAPACRTRSASARAAPRPGSRPGPARRCGRTPRGR